jgi:hypothetical protein
VILGGRRVRLADADPAELGRILTAAGVRFTMEPVRATIEERMLVLARGRAVA